VNELNAILEVPMDASESGYTRLRTRGTKDRPEFVASDVGCVLGIKNVRQNLARMPEDEKGVSNVYTPGGSQVVATVNEAGLYRLVISSRSPAVKKFQRWLLWDVLPSIRKHGCYPPPTVVPPTESAMPTGCDWVDVVRVLADGQKAVVEMVRELTAGMKELREKYHTPPTQPVQETQVRSNVLGRYTKVKVVREELLADVDRGDKTIARVILETRGIPVAANTVLRHRRIMEAAGEIKKSALRKTINGGVYPVEYKDAQAG